MVRKQKGFLIFMKRAVLFAALIGTTYGCATDQAEKLRADRPVSIGSDLTLSVLGGEYRDAKNPNIGIDLAVSRFPHGAGYADISNPSKFFFNALNDALRETKVTGFSFDGGVSWYPFKVSAFRTGLHLSLEKANIEFNALLKDANSTSALPRVTYDRQALYLGVPLGWHWIWENGITWGLDFGPRLRIASEKNIKDDGGSTVDSNDRDQFIANQEDRRKVLLGGLIGYLGYSF